MNRFLYTISALSILATATSCLKYEPKMVNEVEDDIAWTVPDIAKGVLMQVYESIPNRPDCFSGDFLDACTDNALSSFFNSSLDKMGRGMVTSTSCPISVWQECYNQFQHIHKFIERGLTSGTVYDSSSPAADAKAKANLWGEALYLRAWWAAYLLQYHGGRTTDGKALGYPIVTGFISEEEAGLANDVCRNTYEECVEQICRDCDDAAILLPDVTTDAYIGRATSLMAEFLKARVLVTAASPAYQDADVVEIKGNGQYTVLDEASYKAKWERAAKQCWKVIQLSDETEYVPLKWNDLVDIDPNNVVTPSHFVFRYFYKSNGMEMRHFPPFYYGYCQTVPSQNLVDAFPMRENGYPIGDVASGYDSSNPYAGRDNRLDLTVYHHESVFGSGSSQLDVTAQGKDSENYMRGSYRGSRTGYYLAKFLSRRDEMLSPTLSVNALHFYPTMRMAEMFLGLAEASAEAWGPLSKGPGIDVSAYDIVKDIRAKAGGIVNDLYLESVKEDPTLFMNLVINERRLEFAFENFRFFDIRRRLLPLDEAVRGVVVEKDAAGKYSYSTREIEKRMYNGIRFYYLPVPYGEILKNHGQMLNNMDY